MADVAPPQGSGGRARRTASFRAQHSWEEVQIALPHYQLKSRNPIGHGTFGKVREIEKRVDSGWLESGLCRTSDPNSVV